MRTDGDELLIRGGVVFDGSGRPGQVADVLVRDGVVAAIGLDIEEPDADVVDARGKWVMPGFIDCHTHYDAEIEMAPRLGESVRHGVTTVVVGSCGLSFAMGTPEDLADQFCRVEAVPRHKVLPVLEAVKDWDGPASYFDHLERVPLGPNVAAMLGHSAVRASVMGLGRSVDPEVRPTEVEQRTMNNVLGEALDVGYLGMSFNTLPWDKLGGDRHASEPTPSVHATWKEYRRFAAILRRRGSVMQFVPDLAGGVNVPLILALSVGRVRRSLKVSLLAMLDSAAIPHAHRITGAAASVVNRLGRGQARWQALPNRFELLIDGLDAPIMEELGAGTEVLAVEAEKRVALTRDPAWRKRFSKQWSKRLAARAYHRNLAEPTIISCPDSSVEGLSFRDVAVARGQEPLDCFLDLIAEHGSALRWRTVLANGDPREVERIVAHPAAMIGFSDAGAHLRNMAFYDFPLHLLRIARCSPHAISPARAVHRLTGELAEYFDLDGGRLEVGVRADIAVVDPATLDERLDTMVDDDTTELLGVDRIVRRHDECVPLVVVNGRVAWRDGVYSHDFGTTSHGYGRLLRSRAAQSTGLRREPLDLGGSRSDV
jgi:N-acyl-D-aspartate/D-glutamate deacylase